MRWSSWTKRGIDAVGEPADLELEVVALEVAATERGERQVHARQRARDFGAREDRLDDVVVELLADVLAEQRRARRDDLDLIEREDLLEHRADLLGRREEQHERRDADHDAERRQHEVAAAAQRVRHDHAREIADGHHAGPASCGERFVGGLDDHAVAHRDHALGDATRSGARG